MMCLGGIPCSISFKLLQSLSPTPSSSSTAGKKTKYGKLHDLHKFWASALPKQLQAHVLPFNRIQPLVRAARGLATQTTAVVTCSNTRVSCSVPQAELSHADLVKLMGSHTETRCMHRRAHIIPLAAHRPLAHPLSMDTPCTRTRSCFNVSIRASAKYVSCAETTSQCTHTC